MGILEDAFREDQNKGDPIVLASCDDCKWEGKPSDCETYEDSDGWENPTYTVSICPNCEGECVILLRQSDIDGMKKFSDDITENNNG